MKQKCNYCNKNLPLIYFTCKCKNVYCIKHQLPHVHKCNYDYKNDNKKKIIANNPKVCKYDNVN